MKRRFLIMTLLVLTPAKALAINPAALPPSAVAAEVATGEYDLKQPVQSRWKVTMADWILLGIDDGLTFVDWGQTRYVAKHPEFHETNPILGRHPSIGKVDTYFLASEVLKHGVFFALPNPFRKILIGAHIAVEGYYVGDNASTGIKINW